MMVKYAYVIDLSRCVGCRACVEACKVENNTPTGVFWMHVFREEEGKYPNVNINYMPRPCMHCENPPCVKVCPVGARHKQEDGFVLTDMNRCIGCRFCQVACPYGVNYFNWKSPEDNQYFNWKAEGYTKDDIPPYKNPDLEKLYGPEQRLVAGSHYRGVMTKCTWCIHRVEKGMEPACVENCPMHALHFGDLDDPNSEVSELLKTKISFRLLEELGTKPSVYYVSRR